LGLLRQALGMRFQLARALLQPLPRLR
jgi:hypothetical protein